MLEILKCPIFKKAERNKTFPTNETYHHVKKNIHLALKYPSSFKMYTYTFLKNVWIAPNFEKGNIKNAEMLLIGFKSGQKLWSDLCYNKSKLLFSAVSGSSTASGQVSVSRGYNWHHPHASRGRSGQTWGAWCARPHYSPSEHHARPPTGGRNRSRWFCVSTSFCLALSDADIPRSQWSLIRHRSIDRGGHWTHRTRCKTGRLTDLPCPDQSLRSGSSHRAASWWWGWLPAPCISSCEGASAPEGRSHSPGLGLRSFL